MNISTCFEFGYIAKTHGLKGEIVLQITEQTSKDLVKKDLFYILDGGILLPYFIISVSENSSKAICKLEDINTQEEALGLRGKKVYLPNKFKIKKSSDILTINEIIDYTVIDKNIGVVGTVVEVYEIPNNPLLGVIYQSKEALIPYNDIFVVDIDKATKTLNVNLPDGLLELYLSNNHQQDDGQ